MRAVEHGVEAAHEHRVGERGERAGLACQLAQCADVRRVVRPQELGDHDREPVVVPDEVDLVAAAAAEPVQDASARARSRRPRRSPRSAARARAAPTAAARRSSSARARERRHGPPCGSSSSSSATSAIVWGTVAAAPRRRRPRRPAHSSGSGQRERRPPRPAPRPRTAAPRRARQGLGARAGERQEGAGQDGGFVCAGSRRHGGRMGPGGSSALHARPAGARKPAAGFPTRRMRSPRRRRARRGRLATPSWLAP